MKVTKIILSILILFIGLLFSSCELLKQFVNNLPPAQTPTFEGTGATFFDIHGDKEILGALVECGDQFLVPITSSSYFGFYVRVKYKGLTQLKISYDDKLTEELESPDAAVSEGPRVWTVNQENQLNRTDKVYYWLQKENKYESRTGLLTATYAVMVGARNDKFGELKIWTESVNVRHTGKDKISDPLVMNIAPTVHPYIDKGHTIKKFKANRDVVRELSSFQVEWDVRGHADKIRIDGPGFNNELVSHNGSRLVNAPCVPGNQDSFDPLFEIVSSIDGCFLLNDVLNFRVKVEDIPVVDAFHTRNSSGQLMNSFVEGDPVTIEWSIPTAASVNITGDGVTNGNGLPPTGSITVIPGNVSDIHILDCKRTERKGYQLRATFPSGACRPVEWKTIHIDLTAISFGEYWFKVEDSDCGCLGQSTCDIRICARDQIHAEKLIKQHYEEECGCELKAGRCT